MIGQAVLLILLVSVHLLGLYVFVRGFFPERARLERRRANAVPDFPPRYRSRDDADGIVGVGAAPQPRFGRVVLMLVDALRADFLFGNETQMHFTRHLLRTKQALGYVATAHAPTVTLPRIKVC